MAGIVASSTLPGVGLTPAPIIAMIPDSVIVAALKRPSQLNLPNVRGKATIKVAAENIPRKAIPQSPLLERLCKANWPDKSSEP